VDSGDTGNWYFPKADLSFFYFLDFSSIMSNPPILEQRNVVPDFLVTVLVQPKAFCFVS